VECEAAIDEWYKGLNPNQRNPSKYDESDTFTLLSHLAESNDKKTLFFKILPQAYKLNPVPDWTTVQTEDYAAKIKQAKAVIDEAKPDVPVPEIKAKTYEIEAGESLVVSVPKGANKSFTQRPAKIRRSRKMLCVLRIRLIFPIASRTKPMSL